MEDEHDTSALRARRKKSSMGISCCFNTHHHRAGSFDISSILPSPNRMSPSSWIRSKTHDLPENKVKCKNFMSRKGKYRRHSSADFSYDPLSYALNFEDNDEPSEWEDNPRNFSSRLPASPPRATIIASTPSPGKMLSVSGGTSVLPASRAVAVADVMKNPEVSPAGTRNPELQTPRRQSEISRKSAQLSQLRDSLEVASTAEASRSIERSTPRTAGVAEVRRSLEDVTPSRHVVVELC